MRENYKQQGYKARKENAVIENTGYHDLFDCLLAGTYMISMGVILPD